MARRFRIDPNKLEPREPPPPRATCPVSGKAVFASEADAWAEANRIRTLDGTELNIYPCFFCNGWHFTSV